MKVQRFLFLTYLTRTGEYTLSTYYYSFSLIYFYYRLMHIIVTMGKYTDTKKKEKEKET